MEAGVKQLQPFGYRRKPIICSKYNSKDECDSGRSCQHLHVCYHYIKGDCKFGEKCRMSHSLIDDQPMMVLKTFGYDVVKQGTMSVLSAIRTSLVERKENKELFCSDRKLASPFVSRMPDTCYFYNNQSHGGCRDGERCSKLHVCRRFILDHCKSDFKCQLSHELTTEHAKRILTAHSLDVDAAPSIKDQLKMSIQASIGRKGLNEVKNDDIPPLRTSQRQLSESKDVQQKKSSDRGIPKMCSFHLFGRCSFKDDECYNYHSSNNVPYQWQWNDLPDDNGRNADRKWIDFELTVNEDIETRFCDAANERHNVNDGAIGQEVLINFESMTFSGQTIAGVVRRLGTDTVATSVKRNRYTTVWIWYWQSTPGHWQAFPDDNEKQTDAPTTIGDRLLSTHDIETKYHANPDARFNFQINKAGRLDTFLLDVRKMELTSLTKQEISKVRRRPQLYCPQKNNSITESSNEKVITISGQIMSVRFPVHWDIKAMETDETIDYVLVPVMNHGATANEFQKVNQQFIKTMPGLSLKSIKRIQNRDLWESFDAFATRMNKKRQPPVEAKLLFHGTRRQYIEAICQQGFDWRMSGSSTGTAWGKGSYFARDASYSQSYTDCKTMFAVQVLVGDYTRGSSTFVRPPPKDPNKPYQDLFDSVVDDVRNPSIFVTFEKNQSYAEYLLEY